MPGATRVRISIGIKNVKKLAKSELNVTNTLVMPVGRSGASAIPSIIAIIIFYNISMTDLKYIQAKTF